MADDWICKMSIILLGYFYVEWMIEFLTFGGFWRGWACANCLSAFPVFESQSCVAFISDRTWAHDFVTNKIVTHCIRLALGNKKAPLRMNRRRKDFTSSMKLEFFVVLLVSNRHISMKGNKQRHLHGKAKGGEKKEDSNQMLPRLCYHLVDSSVFCSPAFFFLT